MLKSGQYEIIEAAIPVYGMNQNISPESLPENRSYLLENMVALPLGEGKVRYGSKALPSIAYDAEHYTEGLKHDSIILEMFDFCHRDGRQLLLLYVSEFTFDTTWANAKLISAECVEFASKNIECYCTADRIKIEYENSGAQQLIAHYRITHQSENTLRIDLQNNFIAEPVAHGKITKIYHGSGSLYCYDYLHHKLTKLYEHLATNIIPRAVFFKDELIICNGIDNIIRFDGDKIIKVCDYVLSSAQSFKRLDDEQFTFEWGKITPIEKYVGNTIVLKVNDRNYSFQVSDATQTDETVTVKVNDVLPKFENGVKLFYQDYPPCFSFLYVLHNRLWALSEGAVSLSYRLSPLKVYYSYRADSITSWFDEDSKQVSYIDVSNKHGVTDQLEAIGSIQNHLVLFGRKQLQIWSGYNPLDIDNFKWQITLNQGLVHGNLVQCVGNDVLFVSPTGLVSLGTLNIAQQPAVSSVNALDPLIQRYVNSAQATNTAYKNCRSFYYGSGTMIGFKIGFEKTVIATISTQVTSFSLFSGAFQFASSFVSALGRLFLSVGNNVLEYADHVGLRHVYTDDGKAFTFNWALPVKSLKSRRFACKRYDVVADYSSDFAINKANQLSLRVFGDWPSYFDLSQDIHQGYSLDFKGDFLDSVPLGLDSHSGLRLAQHGVMMNRRLQFTARSFWIVLSGQVHNGAFTLKKMHLYGRYERK